MFHNNRVNSVIFMLWSCLAIIQSECAKHKPRKSTSRNKVILKSNSHYLNSKSTNPDNNKNKVDIFEFSVQ